jgi:hypothetical protein
MPVNPVEDVTQVTAVQNAADPQTSAAASQQNKPSVPVDEVTLSPEAAALVAEQQALKIANNGLSPAAEEIQTEQKLAVAAAAGRGRTGQGATATQGTQTTPGALWKATLALTNE